MKYFIATILTKGVKEQIGLYAEDKKQANEIAKLKYSGIMIKVEEAQEPLEAQFKRIKKDLFSNIKKRKIKPDALIASIRQLAVMTNAGISIYDSLMNISTATTDENLKTVFSKLAEDINSGHSLSKSMENFRFELGNLTIAMVQLGEKTGNLDESLYSLADMLEEIRANVVKFKKAMAYPRNVMIAMAIAFTVLISYVVPQFKAIFEELGAELPLPTQILLTLEHLFNNYGPYVLAILFISFVIFKYMINNNKKFRYGWHEILNRTYLIKNIILYATLSRFTLVFSELVRAGIPIAEALDTSIAMIDNLPLKEKLLSVRFVVEKGGTLNKGLEETELFENMIIQMISAGEDSGTLDSMIKKVAEYFKMRFDAIIDGLSEAIEPIMLLLIACMVILLALGIFLPMWDMGSAVQGR
ncbi:MAG: type II secretion system F family protein [Sulfurimonas sp.]|uniref:type II secretion system F family protein n=1 Tax=Sulfurimonas sp. TaxID=2022749 RepID=UPI00263A24E8|nr:type II secretion system F family protein [Sulfurimonas sp.]MCW8894255.1 type II secretion system F family protein [Sulfurimonas sp.]MCW8954004.1 type II secretion system F family protein [Sulfurimonas sp.]MCW9067058.1 type II secretion system F family protein [Sulfurimonas sp.]